jgi:hypothetical protein
MDEIEYVLIAKVNDEVVFKSTYFDTTGLEEELYKAERAVGLAINEENELIEEED